MGKHAKVTYLVGWKSSDGHRLGVNAIMYLPGKEQIVTGGRDSTIRHWRHETLERTSNCHADAVNSLCTLPAHPQYYVSASADNTVYFHGSELHENSSHTDSVKQVCSVLDDHVASSSWDGNVFVHSVARELQVTGRFALKTPLCAVTFSPAHKLIVTGSAEGTLYALDPRASMVNKASIVRGAHKGTIRDAIVCQGKYVATCSSDKTVKVWDLRAMKYNLQCTLHSDAIFSLMAVDDDNFLSGSRDGTIVATNVSALQATTALTLAYPVLGMACTPQNVLYVATTSSSVEGFSLSHLLDACETGATSPDLATPSRIFLSLGDEGKMDDLVQTDTTKYTLEGIKKVEFGKGQKQTWCTSIQNRPVITGRSDADFQLRGSPGIIDCCVLEDKRHALSLSDDNTVSLWNLVSRELVKIFPQYKSLKEAMKAFSVPTYCPGWCLAECRWGCLAITLSMEEAFKGQVDKWTMEEFGPEKPQPKMSIYSISRSKREMLRKAPRVNLGHEALKSLFRQSEIPSIMYVWPSEACSSSTSTDRIENSTVQRYDVANNEYECEIPLWVDRCVRQPDGDFSSLRTQQSSATVALALRPQNKSLPSLPKGSLSMPRTAFLSDVCEELVHVLKLSSKIPKLKEVQAAVAASNSGLTFVAEGEELFGQLLPEEFIELLTFDEKQVVDPMTPLSTAVILHKEKGKGILELVYRKNIFLPS